MSTSLERRQAQKIERLRDQHEAMLAALKAAAPHVPVDIQAQVINAINLATKT